jgi:hypothetical protein
MERFWSAAKAMAGPAPESGATITINIRGVKAPSRLLKGSNLVKKACFLLKSLANSTKLD